MFQVSATSFSYALVGFVALSILAKFVEDVYRTFRLRAIPTVGTSVWSMYYGIWHSLVATREMVCEGYHKHYGQAFKIPQFGGWMVLIAGPEMVEDLRRAPDDQVSFSDALEGIFHTEHTIGNQVVFDDYQVDVIRTSFTRNMDVFFPDFHDEVKTAFSSLVPLSKGWTKHNVPDTARRIVAQATSRLFVGLPLCRNPEYLEVNLKFTKQLVDSAGVTALVPNMLAPIAIPIFANIPKRAREAKKLLRPLLEERITKAADAKEWESQLTDLISLLLQRAEGKQRTVEDLTSRILFLGFGSIHSASGAFNSAIFFLAAYPEYIPALREEAEQVIEEEGWTRAAMSKMHKLDSFLKECSRMHGQSIYGPTRKVLKDFTFSNGQTLPAGTNVSIASQAMHLDERFYKDAEAFKPFRFYEMAAQDGKTTHQMLTASPEYLSFGYGRHACPGRVFAVNAIKLMVSHLILNYDVKLEAAGRAPPNPRDLGNATFRESDLPVLFRARQ